MRSVGLGLAFAATVQFVLVSTPAFAQGPATDDTGKTPAAAPAAATPSSATPAAAPAAGKVTVHIQSSSPVSLEHRAPGQSAWQFVCGSPCDQAISTTDEYHIVGTGLNDSKPPWSTRPRATGSPSTCRRDARQIQHRDVDPRRRRRAHRRRRHRSPRRLEQQRGSGQQRRDHDRQEHQLDLVGTAAILGGVILGITGGSMMVNNTHTKVDATESEKKDDQAAKSGATASRLPTWHDEKGPVAPVANVMPLFHTTF